MKRSSEGVLEAEPKKRGWVVREIPEAVPHGVMKWERPLVVSSGSGTVPTTDFWNGGELSWRRERKRESESSASSSLTYNVPVPKAQNKQQRAQERRNKFAHEVLSQGANDLTILENHSVANVTRNRYHEHNEMFKRWALLNRRPISTHSQIDAALAHFFQDLFLDGEGVGVGNYVLAAVVFLTNNLSAEQLPRARKCLKGWKKLAPPGSRLPLPRAVIALIIHDLVRRDKWRVGVGCMAATECYLRPGELVHVQMRDWVPPSRLQVAGLKQWSLLLHPLERQVASKVGSYDDTVLLDKPHHLPLTVALGLLKSRLQPTDTLIGISGAELERQVKLSAQNVGVGTLSVVPYMFRHSGASHDRSAGLRSLNEVRKRGRWATEQSVRRYEKGGRLAQQFASLPPEVQNRAARAEANIMAILSGNCVNL